MRAPTGGTLRRWGFRALLLVSLVGAVLAYGGPLLYQVRGQSLIVLTSGSMGKDYPPGTAVVAEPVTPDQLRVGQVITFKQTAQGRYVTHRIYALKTLTRTHEDGTPMLDASGRPVVAHYVQTKGDDNAAPDPNLTPVGEVRYLVVDKHPGWGAFLLWSRTLTGKLLLFAPPFVLLLMAEMWSWRNPVRRSATQPPGPSRRHDDVAPAVV